MAAIELRGVVSARGGRRTLDGASLTLAFGEIAVVTGPVGAGKTRLLELCALLAPPEAGEARALGRTRAEADAAHRRRIGVAEARPRLLEAASAAENAALGLRLAGAAPAVRRAQAGELLDWLGLDAARAAAPAGALSAGERRLVALARAAAAGPELLVADQPTGDLDAAGAERVEEMLAALAAQGAAVIVATGDEGFARRLARRAEARPMRLEGGRLVGRGAG